MSDPRSEPVIDYPPEHFDDADQRALFFGTSHTAVLFNAHPFETAADYWLDKRDGRVKQTTQPMIRGQFLEAAIADWFACTASDGPRLPIRRVNPQTRGHLVTIPDYEIADADCLVSIKSTTRTPDEPETYWLMQLQAEMLVTAHSRGIVAWMDGRQELHHVEVDGDLDLQHEIWLRSKEFMDSIGGDMPEWVFDSHTASSIVRQFPDPEGVVEADAGILETLKEYHRLKDEAKEYDAAANELRTQLFKFVQGQEAIVYEGTPLATFKKQKGRSGIDTKALAQQYPDIAAEFTYEGEPTRALRIPKQALDILNS
jgi:predicted phage-related endonuclease